MANIEEHAIQRDKRFLVRLVLVMLVAIFAGLFIWGQLTGDEVSGCAATSTWVKSLADESIETRKGTSLIPFSYSKVNNSPVSCFPK